MKTLLVTLTLLLTACGKPDQVGTSYSGDIKFKRVCIDNVQYLIRTKGSQGIMAPHFKPDGTLHTCN